MLENFDSSLKSELFYDDKVILLIISQECSV